MYDLLINIINTTPKRTFLWSIKHNEKLLSWIYENSPDDCKSLLERIRIVLGDEYICNYGNRKKFRDGRFVACGKSNICKCRYEKETKKRKQTCLAKYGTNTPFQSETIKNKIKQTNLKKYGVENPAKSKNILEKRKETNLKKYGVEYAIQLNKTKEKYNHEAANQKRKKTVKQKYGVEYFFHKDDVRKKAQNTKYNKNQIKEKEFLEKYDENDTIYDMITKFDIGLTRLYQLIQKYNLNFKTPRVTQGHQELYNFLNYYVKCKLNDRSIIPPQEIDIWLPEYNLGVEFNGVYWHSSKYKPNDFHLKKTKLCEQNDIQLIHIFEDEWLSKQEIVKSRLLHLLNKTPNKVYARKCQIKEVNPKETKEFLLTNHIQGYIGSAIKLGLYHNEELVSIMTFGAPRYDKKYNWELLRFCNKNYMSIAGGASKLFNYFIKNYEGTIISYANRRWSNGGLYKQLGFKFKYNSSPNYWYMINGLRESREKYQKHKLHKILENFDPKITEEQNMFNHNYPRIYDCGNQVWLFTPGE